MAKMNRERLEVRRVKAKRALSYQKRQILLCAGTGCIAGGSLKLYDYFKEECARRGLLYSMSRIVAASRRGHESDQLSLL